ncbi:MAG: TraB/GumN family protein [Spirochaetaceae bacterium]|jgi:pheromone shutdown-related protein TraB|nr:TraB/GumN family protein [Spirochaetaceae bacterium]
MSDLHEKPRVCCKRGDKEIIILGAAHVSKESVREAAALVEGEKPDVVCVELDKSRYDALVKKDDWEKLDIVKAIREGKGFLLAANLVLSGFQRRLGNELGVKPGDEMCAAIECAAARGIPHRLCDRELQITLRRAWESCSLWSKCKLLAALLASAFSTEKLSDESIEALKQKNELDGMMGELSAYLPSVKKTLIDERDQYIAIKIWQALDDSAVRRAAAIVGVGHLNGIRAHLELLAADEAAGADSEAGAGVLAELERIPPASIAVKILSWVVPFAIAALIVMGFIHSGINAGVSSLVRWVLWNGSLAAAGALIALAHPLAILAAFVGAPIGTLSPFISIGVLSGITQALIRPPRVIDAESLSADAASLKGIYKNRITRVIVVFFLSSLGGAIGNIISIPALAKSLF